MVALLFRLRRYSFDVMKVYLITPREKKYRGVPTHEYGGKLLIFNEISKARSNCLNGEDIREGELKIGDVIHSESIKWDRKVKVTKKDITKYRHGVERGMLHYK